ncbi:MAG: hypothetical protein E6J32_09685 [Chloroflexi bacterium]|nr:MAG: hypothetical protein E6J32_09685 [Chloroflexota bacterium]
MTDSIETRPYNEGHGQSQSRTRRRAAAPGNQRDYDSRPQGSGGLEHAKGFIRRELGARLSNLRFAPDLHFQLDEGVAYSVRVSQLLREVEQGESNAGR